ncbi:50S ribosomal protein L25 [Clostridium sp. BJN0001]|uniref:50S ribosomal protein L25 n=1 Tax=Clostridium sp. BJN0001 TaxID=2930219 RepID=UPI001FCFBEA9|nr:50S ribosomal protein L25 [Clostridium sp. BJN0001]
MEQLVLTSRQHSVNHEAKKVLREGNIPGVVYGKEIGNKMFKVSRLDLEKELTKVGEHGVLGFKIEDKEGTAVIKEVQKNPVSQKIIHIDLEEVGKDQEMETEVFIKFVGKALVSGKGGVFQTNKDSIKVICTAENLPKEIELDVSNGTIGTVYTCADLKMPANVKLGEDAADVIASITTDEEMPEASDDSDDNTAVAADTEAKPAE